MGVGKQLTIDEVMFREEDALPTYGYTPVVARKGALKAITIDRGTLTIPKGKEGLKRQPVNSIKNSNQKENR